MIRRVDRSRLGLLWPFVRPHGRAFVGAAALLALSFGVELLGPWLVRNAVDGPIRSALDGAEGAGRALLTLGALYFAAVVVGGSTLGYAFAVTTARAGKAVIRDLRTALTRRLLELDARWHDAESSGRSVTRVTADVDNLDQLLTTGALHAVFDLAKLVGLAVAIGVFAPPLLGLALVACGAAATISMLFRNTARAAYGAVRHDLAQQNGLIAEASAGIRTVRALGAERAIGARCAAANRRTRDAWRATIRRYATFFASIDASLRLSQAGMLWIGGLAVARGDVTTGALVQAWLYFQKLIGPIRDLGERYNVLQSALASAERIAEVFEAPSAPADPEDPGLALADGALGVEFRDVCFGYRPEQPVLQGVDLTIPAGTTCAVVGPTGAGKSTLLALLSRIHDVDSGSIEVGGAAVQRLPLAALRRRVVVVPQEPVMIRGTLRDNLVAQAADPSQVRIEKVLDEFGLQDLVRARGGLDAELDGTGAGLSRGERQLLSMGRAAIAEPDVLVLDEATASLDSATETRLARALVTLCAGRTVVVVAHRLATVRTVDQIAVLEHGKIVERGRHDELAASGGHYAAMLRAARSSEDGP
ncbi:MAG: ABC transporter ATP-binding protein [Planctomycetota bacterium]|nr:ABC transporter ATP-binding protein [Planctomycetota bacterium]